MSIPKKLDSDARVASFDVFDTLVARACGSPQTVFSCVERRALQMGLDVEGFAEERAKAECRAIGAVGEQRLKLEDIYANLRSSRLCALRDQLMEMEKQAEVDLCVPIKGGVELYRRCLKSYEAVVIVSDMYLPADLIARILKSCGITGYAKLFVSCEYGETKSVGGLYEVVASDLGVSLNQIVHYGDNLHSDFLSARKRGIRAGMMADGKEIPFVKAVSQKLAKKALPSRPHTSSSFFLEPATEGLIDQIGYCVFGPLLVSFCEWLHERREVCQLDGLWFAARDGWIMKRCYDLLYPGEPTEYLLVSRRSITVPMLSKNPGIAGFVKTVGLGREMSTAEILMRLGLSDEQAAGLEEAHGLKPDERLLVDGLEKNTKFTALFEEAGPLISRNTGDELAAMATYLNEIFGDARAIGLVDLGWRGSIQHALETALPEIGLGETRVDGFYLGVDVDSAWWGKQSMDGFLYSPDENEEDGVAERWFNALVEALFMAPYGTVRRYVASRDGSAVAELEPREGGNEDSSPLFEVQEAALRFARDYRERRWGEYGFIERGEVVRAFYRLGLEPTFDEARTLGDCVFAYQEVSCLARPRHAVAYYLTHPRELVREMNVCYWKPAFLRRMVPLPIAYWRILAFVKRTTRGDGTRGHRRGRA